MAMANHHIPPTKEKVYQICLYFSPAANQVGKVTFKVDVSESTKNYVFTYLN
jgi:hypothetical protein